MSGNAQKTPLAHSAHQLSGIKAQDVIDAHLPQSFPATVVSLMGWLVKVNLEGNFAPFTTPKLLVPIARSHYEALPLQAGDPGVIIGVNYYIGGVAGFGGTANIRPRANLTNSIFVPIGNKSWANPPGGGNLYVGQGPNGAVIQDINAKSAVTVTPTEISWTDQYGNQVVSQSGKIFIKLGPGNKLYLGGDGVTGIYGNVRTTSGDCMSVFARVDAP